MPCANNATTIDLLIENAVIELISTGAGHPITVWSQKVLLLTLNLYGEHSRAASTKWKSVSTVSVKIAISRRQK